jgi:periplasmic protein TonB
MKQFLLLMLCLFCFNLSYCQTVINKAKDKNIIFTKTEVPPAYPGGEDALRNFYRKNLNTNIKLDSNDALRCLTITVKFIVRKNGSITDANCENPGCEMCQEFIRVIKNTGKWLPAVQNGKKVNAYYRQSIVIDVEEF